jgi:hypothetical protein
MLTLRPTLQSRPITLLDTCELSPMEVPAPMATLTPSCAERATCTRSSWYLEQAQARGGRVRRGREGGCPLGWEGGGAGEVGRAAWYSRPGHGQAC